MKLYLIVLLLIGFSCGAACPSADLTGDCFVDMADLDKLAGQWLTNKDLYNSDARNGNCRIVYPGDDVMTAYNWLKSSERDAQMGTLSASNRRTLLLAPGVYACSPSTWVNNYVNYVDIQGSGPDTILNCGNSLLLIDGFYHNRERNMRITNLTLINNDGMRLSCPAFPFESLPQANPMHYFPQPDFAESCDPADWEPVRTIETEETNLVRSGTKSARYSYATTGTAGARQDFGEGNEKNWCRHVFFFRYYLDPAMVGSMSYNHLYMYFFDDAGYSNYAVIGSLPLAPGWNEITFCPSQMSYHGTMTDLFSVRGMQLTCNFPTGGGFFILDTFLAIPTGREKAGIIFTFDDGFLSSYTNGIRYLEKYGFRSMWYIAPERIVNNEANRQNNSVYGDYAIWDEVKAAASAGALICTHSITANPKNSIDALEQYCIRQKSYLTEKGFSSADYWCIPAGADMWAEGTLTERQIMDVLSRYFIHVRGTHPWWNNAKRGATFCGNSAPQPYYLKENRYGWSKGSGSSMLQSDLDRVIAEKDVYSIYLHSITDSTNPSTADFQTFVDYVKTQADAGVLEVITYEDLLFRN